MAETYTEMLRRALGNTAGPAGFLLNENAALLNLFRRLRPESTRPATPPAAQPTAPTTPTTPQEPARRAPLPAQAAPAEETPETFEAMRQFQAGLREQQMQGGGQLSVLDMLRKRMANAMEDEQARRISDLGTALLASRSPNFFTALGEGLAAQSAGERSRMEELRRVADLERQDAAQRAEEARRAEELRIREAAQAAEAPLRAAQTEQALALAAEIRAGRGRGTITPAVRLRAEGQALTEARTLFPDPPRDAVNREALVAQVEQQRRNYIAQRLPALVESLATPGAVTPAPATGGGAANQPAPAAILDLSGRQTSR